MEWKYELTTILYEKFMFGFIHLYYDFSKSDHIFKFSVRFGVQIRY